MEPQTQSDPTLALAITKAIGYTENGGRPDINNPSEGKSGELKSIFQYTPETWKAVAGKELGNPDAPIDSNNETIATGARVQQWLQKGYTPQQIFSMWNAGQGEPDAYSGKFSDGTSSVGTNKHGIKFSVPDYVNKGMKYLSEFEPEMKSKLGTTQGNPSPSIGPDEHVEKVLSSLKPALEAKANVVSADKITGLMPTNKGPKGPQISGLLNKSEEV